MISYGGSVRKPFPSLDKARLIRFRPPRTEPSPEVRWALLRAFAPRDLAVPLVPSPGLLPGLAQRLDLAPRIAFRSPSETLARELGEAGPLIAARGLAALGADRQLALARDVAVLARTCGLPLALLKGAALHATGVVPAGSRWTADLDVLVPADAVAGFDAALRGAGFRSELGAVGSEHQTAPLHRGEGEIVEIHRFLPGVAAPGSRRFATHDVLAKAGMLIELPGWPTPVSVPAPVILAAHALVHGLAQHGFAPRAYPLTRMLADLVDLGAAGPEGEALMAEAHAWTERHVTAEEVRAVLDLVRALVAGRLEASPLLSHVLAGLLDEDYVASLKLRALGSGPSQHSQAFAVGRDAWHALFPGTAQLAGLHPKRAPWLSALLRPFDLAARAARAVVAGVR